MNFLAVSETLTITGTGTFNIKLPGNANSAGVQTTAIMRYGKGVVAPAAPPPPPSGTTLCKTAFGFFVPCAGGRLLQKATKRSKRWS